MRFVSRAHKEVCKYHQTANPSYEIIINVSGQTSNSCFKAWVRVVDSHGYL